MSRAPRTMLWGIIACTAPLALLDACYFDWDADKATLDGGVGGGAGGERGASSSSGNASTSSGSGSVGDEPPCPPEAPTPGTSCGYLETTCEYGDDPRPACRLVVVCNETGWTSMASCSCAPLPACPRDVEAYEIACSADEPLCALRGGTFCECVDEEWYCPEANDGCPAWAPNRGQSCYPDDLECEPGECENGTRIERTCRGGVWEEGDAACDDAPTGCP